MSSVESIINDLERSDFINFDKSFEYAKFCSKLLRDYEMEGDGRKIVINILDNWDKISSSTHEMWTDLIESSGFYPYLEKEKNRLVFKNIAGEIRKEFHKSDELDKYFHDEQKLVSEILKSGKNVIVSAPTSFGKSLLIEEIVASKKYKNIVIIQPTLALIDETRKNLKKYDSAYKLIVRTTQRPSEERGNIFLLTAERVMEYSELPKIEFFVIDEFYKLSAKRDEERSDVLNNAFNLLLNKHKSKFYLLGPNIDGISKGFKEKYDAEFFKTNYTLVDNRVIDVSSENFGTRGVKKANKEKALFDLLFSLKNEQTIIYCSSPAKARYLARCFCDYLKEKDVEMRDDLSIIEWLKLYINPKWGLIDCLRHGIGIHDGALQKHLTSSIIQYFNAIKLNFLFCTTTIIEGVNTSAKNVVFFSRTKGLRKPIDYFDYCNIKGRSGRLFIHYIGKMYNFNKPPEREKIIVDIPFFEQDPISDEVLIHIDDENVKNKETDQYVNLQKIPEKERELFKKNGLSVRGQAKIMRKIREDIDSKKNLLIWDRYPTYDQLGYGLSLGWNNLIKSGETIRPMTLNKLTYVTFKYMLQQNIYQLIEDNYKYFREMEKYSDKPTRVIFDEAVRDAFQILRHWFHYKVPKWLNVINSLQKYVCEERGLKSGDYTYFSTQIESDFVRENLAILVEYGIPKSAIVKMEKRISRNLDQDEVLDEIRKKNLLETSYLIEYEKEKIRENL